MASTTHIAAPKVTIGSRILQRCLVCGFKLCDNINVAMPLEPDGSVPKFPTFPEWELIRCTEGNPTHWEVLPHKNGEHLPKDACINSLVE